MVVPDVGDAAGGHEIHPDDRNQADAGLDQSPRQKKTFAVFISAVAVADGRCLESEVECPPGRG